MAKIIKGEDYNLNLPGHFIRRRIERWLWSGGRLRTWLARKAPTYLSDVDCVKSAHLPPLHGGYRPRENGRRPVANPPKPPGGRG